MSFARLRLVSLAALLAVAAGPALPGDDHGHGRSLPDDPHLSVSGAVEAAAERLRLGQWNRQRAAVAASRRARGGAWLGDAPALAGTWHDYSSLNDHDYYEAELFVSLPLWRVGERKARRELAEQDAALARLEGEARLLAVAGDVRQALWQVLEARTRVTLLEQGEANARRYAEQMAQRVAGGDASQADLLQSRQLVLKLRSQVLEASALLVDQSRRWRLITGLDALPQEPAEQAAAIDGIRAEHPLLLQARARVDWLRAELQAQRKGGSQRPALQLGVKREDVDQLAPPLDSVGIGFAVPLGRGRDNAVTVEQTSQALLEAEVAAQALQRELKEELHDVRHQINIIERHMSDSGALLEIAQQVLAMEQLANRQGEITVIEVLRAGQGLAEARQRHAVLTLQRQALTARYNQVVGELPR